MKRPYMIGALLWGVLFLLLTLAGCQPTSTDGYAFGKKEFTHLAPDITFITHSSQQALVNAAPVATRNAVKAEGRDLKAWSTLKGAGHNICVVHIVDPAVTYVPEFIGHEIAHCIYGRWHA